MADPSQIHVVLVAYLVDPGDQPVDRTIEFVKSAAKNAPRNARGTSCVGVVLYDEEDVLRGEATHGRNGISQRLGSAVEAFKAKLKRPEEKSLI
jgi:hypothetical protein